MRNKIAIKRICENCGKEFSHDNIYYKKRFCCPECYFRYKRGLDTRVYKVNDDFLKQDTHQKYYIIGLMAADGCIYTKGHQGIHLNLSGDEGLKLLEYVKEIMGCESPIYSQKFDEKHPTWKTRYILHCSSKELVQDFINNGVVPRKTFNTVIPQYILNDEIRLRYFLIGYIDGDGCIGMYHKHNSKKGISYTLDISFVCCDSMKVQLENLNVFQDAVICKNKNGVVWQVCFNGRKAIQFGEWLYKDFDEAVFHSYKYFNYKDYMDNRYELTPFLRKKEMFDKLKCEIQRELDANPLMKPKQIRDKYNVSLRYAEYQTQFWRQQHNMSFKQVKEQYGEQTV